MARSFGSEERETIQHQLQQNLEAGDVSHRQAHSGSLAYIEGYRAIELANVIFGFDGWSCEIREMHEDFVTQASDTRRWSAGFSCTVRVTLRDGTFREDIGYGESQSQPQQGTAREIARKSASTDGLKRALRLFGRALGLCLYDSEFRTTINKRPHGTARPPAGVAATGGRPPAPQQSHAVQAARPPEIMRPPQTVRPPLPGPPLPPAHTMVVDASLDNFELSGFDPMD